MAQIDEVESAFAIFLTSKESEEFENVSIWLKEWQNSNEAPATAVDIIASSQNNDFCLFVATFLERKITSIKDILERDFVAFSFATILDCLRSCLFLYDERCRYQLIRVLAAFSVFFSEYISFWPSIHQLGSDELIFYFYSVITHPMFEIQQINLDNIVPLIFQALKIGNPTKYWVSLLHKTVFIVPNISDFNIFIDGIQDSSNNAECIPALCDFLEELTAFEYVNLDENEASFFHCFFDIMLRATSLTPMNFDAVSFVLVRMIEFSIEFFVDELNLELSRAVIDLYFNSLEYICYVSEEDFLPMLETFVHFFSSLANFPGKLSLFSQESSRFLYFLIEYADSDSMKYEESIMFSKNQIYDILKEGFTCLMKFSIVEIPSKIYSRIDNPTPGILFCLSCIPIEMQMSIYHKTITSIINNIIIHPTSILYCCSISKILSFEEIYLLFETLSPFFLENQVFLSDFFRYIANIHPSFFSQYANEYYWPFFQIIEECELTAKASIITFLIVLLPNLDNERKSQSLVEIFNSINNTIVLVLGIDDEDSEIICIEFLTRVLRLLAPQSTDKSTLEFIRAMFKSVMEAIGFLFQSSNETIQFLICHLVESAIRVKWIADFSIVVDWLCSIIWTYPIPRHFYLLSRLYRHVPHDFIETYLESFEQNCDPAIHVSVLSFLQILAREKTEGFWDIISEDTIINPLRSTSPSVVEECLHLINAVSLMPTTSTTFKSLATKSIIDGFFQNFMKSAISKGISIITTISNPVEIIQFFRFWIPDTDPVGSQLFLYLHQYCNQKFDPNQNCVRIDSIYYQCYYLTEKYRY